MKSCLKVKKIIPKKSAKTDIDKSESKEAAVDKKTKSKDELKSEDLLKTKEHKPKKIVLIRIRKI